MVGPVHQVVLHRVAEGVGHLVDDVVGIDEANDAGLLGGPEVLPATAQGVLALGEELVEMLDECRVAAVGVVDARVMMVAHRDGEEDTDTEPLGGDCKAVDERVVGLAVRPHQELSLGAAARDHVRTLGKDLTGSGHARVFGAATGSVVAKSTSVG